MWNRVEIKKTAKSRLKSYQGKAILVCLIIAFIEWLPEMFKNDKFVGMLESIITIHPNLTEDGLSNYVMFCTNLISPKGTLETILSDIPLFALVVGFVLFRLVLTCLILTPLKVGQKAFFYKNQSEEQGIDELAYAFDARIYKNITKTEFIAYMHIWFYTLLFIIPGIVCSFSYYFVSYILVDQPLMSTKDALDLSKKMTDGHKKEIFVYVLSFIGWYILSMLTFGITDILYGIPYRQAADAELYTELKRLYNSKLIECVESE